MKLEKKGIEIVIMSQCQKGHVDCGIYSKDNYFSKLDLIHAADMTVEATVTKLAYLMGKGLRGQELKKQFTINLRGEQTPLAEIENRVVRLMQNLQ